MSERFSALRIHRNDGVVRSELEEISLDDLSPGNVLVRVEYSSINYKDALAATGSAPILRRFPLVGGIDLAGEVLECTDGPVRPGDKIVVLGGGIGENRDGGYARIARVEADRVIRLPEGIDTRRAMAIGTAGFTAALAVHRLEHNGQRPELGPMAVTGATGGVGTVAIDLLAGRGYEVTALTGKTSESDYLQKLGAGEIIDRRAVEPVTKPLGRGLWGGAVDNLGGEILSWLTRTVRPWGNIASIGLAAGAGLSTTVMPFILRSVSLIGVNMEVEPQLRRRIWERLAGDLQPRHLERIATREVTLTELPPCFDDFMAGSVTGRTVVRID
ncbi:MAG: acryloyl-CoA reductase [Rhodospirillaceae bacterium]|nr:acryloyl-CoA reductase [Rhodospirillaceae bacterium]MDD9996379.1 acryloyl-CoA reductase [Rhodospirillaceae bacterium]